MQSEWLALEHHRIHLMEQWPDGPRKEAGLNSARSALQSLLLSVSNGAASGGCSSKPQRTTPVRFSHGTRRREYGRLSVAEDNVLAAA